MITFRHAIFLLIYSFSLSFSSVWAFNDEHSTSKTKPLATELAIFEPYLGTWQSEFSMDGGKTKVLDVSRWERALNGKAVRTLHSINDGYYGGESLIFFDKAKQQVVFYYFTTADFFTVGRMEIVDNSFVAYEQVAGSADGITQVKSTSTLEENQMVVATQYLKNSQWTSPEKRRYVRSTKHVKFQ